MKTFDFLETRYRSIIVSGLIMVAGLVLIVAGNEISNKQVVWYGVNVGGNISNLGSLIGIIGLMQWMYDYFSRKKFFEEVIMSVAGTRAIYDLGVVDAKARSSDADLLEEIELSDNLVLVFSHSKRFIDRYHDAFAKRMAQGKKTTFYMNHKDSHAVKYYIACGRGEDYVLASIKELQRVLEKLDNKQGLITIKMIDVMPKYALVMSDRCAHFICATSSEGQVTVPLLTVRRDTPLWRFFKEDLRQIDENNVKEVLNG